MLAQKMDRHRGGVIHHFLAPRQHWELAMSSDCGRLLIDDKEVFTCGMGVLDRASYSCDIGSF